MDLADLQVRSNGQTVKVDASWWNDIRLVLLGLFGTGVTAAVQQALSNNTTAVVTNLIFASASIVDFEVNYTIVRGSLRQSGKLRGYFTTTWNLSHEADDDAGVTFSIDGTTGQVSYTTDNSSTGKMQWKVISTFSIEA